MSMVYGLIYLLFEAYPIIFSDVHHLTPGYASLPFLSTFVGAILSGKSQISRMISSEMGFFIFRTITNDPTPFPSQPLLLVRSLIYSSRTVPLTLWFQKRYVLSTKRNSGISTPEMRLPPSQLGGILIVIAFIWLGWSGEYARVPWIVPTLSGIVQGIGSVLIFVSSLLSSRD